MTSVTAAGGAMLFISHARSVAFGLSPLPLLMCAHLLAGVPSVQLNPGGRLADRDRLVGYEFQLSREITVTDLGKFDANENGLLDDLSAPQVGIWDTQTGELVVATTIDLGAALDHGAFYSSIAETRLPAGNYIIASQAFDLQEPYAEWNPFATSGAVQWVRGWYQIGTDFVYPKSRRSVASHFGPSFKTDEPTVLFSPGERSVFQRNAENMAQIPLAGIVSADVDRLEARAVVMDGFTGTGTDWQPINFADGLLQGQLTLPAGGWYRIETRGYQGDEIVYGDFVDRVGVGEVFVAAGQSNAANYAQPAMSAASDLVSAFTAEGSWQHAEDPQPIANGTTGSPWPALGDLLVEQLDVPIGFVSVAWGGTSVDQWLPGVRGPAVVPLYDRLKAALQDMGPDGVRAVLWLQGESDSLLGTSSETYAERLQAVIDASREDAGYDVEWSVGLASWLPGTSAEVEAEIVAGQLKVIADDPLVFQGTWTNDLIGPEWRHDNVHMNEQGLRENARRWADAITRHIIPEPSTMHLALAGCLAILMRHSRRCAQSQHNQS